jgi:hypothetical protein
MVRAEFRSLRFSRLEKEWLMAALLVSLFVHLAAFGTYEAGKKFGWWKRLHPVAALHKVEKKNPPPVLQDEEPPMVFVDVSHAEQEPPKKAKYYSNKNSQAANPDAKDSDQPKLNGRQKDVPKTEDVPMLPKLQPSPPREQSAESKPAEESQPASPMNMGDLALNKLPDEKAAEQQKAAPSQHQRPRTLAEARQELPGQQLQQAGGVQRHRVWSSLDAKATAFGDYDRAIIEAVTQHWYDLLDSHRFAEDRTGKVILSFKLKPDGSVVELTVLENTVGELLGYVCEESVQEAAPFSKWPTDMQRMIGANFREVTFTFYYY